MSLDLLSCNRATVLFVISKCNCGDVYQTVFAFVLLELIFVIFYYAQGMPSKFISL